MKTLASTFRSTFSAAIAGTLLLAGAPAVAAEGADKAAAPAEASEGPKEQKKICLSPTVTGAATVTGSVLSRKECRTRAQWEERGVIFEKK